MRDGIHISVDDICSEAGVSKGALYGYFPSKEAVIQAIADEHVADLSSVRDARQREQLIAAIAERLSDGDTAANRLEMEAWAYAFSHEELRARLLENTGQLQSSIASALRRITGADEQSTVEFAGIIETFALGLVVKSALGDNQDVGKPLSALLSILCGTTELRHGRQKPGKGASTTKQRNLV